MNNQQLIETRNNEFAGNQKTPKEQRYGWEIIDTPGHLKMISKHDLLVDYDYQRESTETKIKDIARNWSWVGCGAICVARRGSVFYVIDGQHRVAAAKRRSDINELPCVVFDVSSKKQEAVGFLLANANRKPVTAIGKYKAQIVSGDSTAIFVSSLLSSLGIDITDNHDAHKATKSIRLCYKLASIDRECFSDVMTFIARLCEKCFIRERIIDGIYYLHTHGLDITDGKVKKRILAVGPERLLSGAGKASALFSKGGAKIWAQGMLVEINKGSRTPYELN